MEGSGRGCEGGQLEAVTCHEERQRENGKRLKWSWKRNAGANREIACRQRHGESLAGASPQARVSEGGRSEGEGKVIVAVVVVVSCSCYYPCTVPFTVFSSFLVLPPSNHSQTALSFFHFPPHFLPTTATLSFTLSCC